MLTGFRILDLTGELGPLGPKMLSDMGAEVIKIEKPAGSPERNLKPYYNNEPDPEKSLVFWAFNTGKKGITLNLESAQGKEIFLKLVKTADAVVESFDYGYMDKLGLGYKDLQKVNPKLVYTAITPYGQTGPYKEQGWKYTDLTLWAMGGTMASCGYPDRPPVRMSVHQVSSQAGAYAALGTLTALFGAQRTGEGCMVDVSAYEAIGRLGMLEPSSWLYRHRILHRSGSSNWRGPVLLRQVWPCKDGIVAMRLSSGKQARTLKPLVDWIIAEGEGDLLKQYNWENLPLETYSMEEVDRIQEAIGSFLLKHTKDELFSEALKRRYDLVAVHNAADIMADDQLEFRKFWSEIEHEDIDKTFKYPGTAFVSTEGRWAATKRAPHLGEHNHDVYGDLGIEDSLKALKEGGVI